VVKLDHPGRCHLLDFIGVGGFARHSALAPYKLRNISGCSVTVEAVRAAPLLE
jgi:hypothetical protein